jgi:xanthine dehydrogenase YagS FAD-binding subunit
MRSIQYVKATSWRQASRILEQDPLAKPIAGGSDVLGWIKDGIVGPGEPRWQAFVDIRTIDGSDRIEFSESAGLRIGALATLDAIEHTAEIQQHYPVLAKAAAAAASPNIRHVGTLGGNLNQRPRCWYLRNSEFNCFKKGGDFCYAVTGSNVYHAILGGEKCFIVHPSDTAPAMLALDATAVISTPDGEKRVPFGEYFVGPRVDILRENVLQQGDLLVEVRIPTPKQGSGMSFLKAQWRGQTYDFALANVATVIAKQDGVVEDARVVMSGVAPTPVRATGAEDILKGKAVDAALARQAADAALQGARPMTDNAYKVTLAKNLVTRSILEAWGQS